MSDNQGTKPGKNVGKWGKKVEISGHQEAEASNGMGQASKAQVLKSARAKNSRDFGASKQSFERESNCESAGKAGKDYSHSVAKGVKPEGGSSGAM